MLWTFEADAVAALAHRPDPPAAGRLRFAVLGPLAVTRDGVDRTPRSPKQRALLALLVLRCNELVPTAALVDGVWGDCPPRCALPALQGYMSAVRRLLGGAGSDARRDSVVRTELSGYVLEAEAGSVDFQRFGAVSAEGRRFLAAGRLVEARQAFDRALGLWRGPLLAGQPMTGTLAAAAVRFEEERLSVLQARIDVDFRLGRAAGLVGELEELCALYPLREPLYERLMVALASSGRSVEALGVYGRARRVMVGEAGVEPGPRLRRMQQAVLRGEDPAELVA